MTRQTPIDGDAMALGRRRGRRALAISTVAVMAIDVASKVIAIGQGGIHRNLGVAFGLLAGFPSVALAASSLVTAGAFWYGWKLTRTRAAGLAWGLICGGAVGNVFDRVALSPGHWVVDWISVPLYPASFNLADVAIRVGCLVVVGPLMTTAVQRARGPSAEGGAMAIGE